MSKVQGTESSHRTVNPDTWDSNHGGVALHAGVYPNRQGDEFLPMVCMEEPLRPEMAETRSTLRRAGGLKLVLSEADDGRETKLREAPEVLQLNVSNHAAF
jgi:hypothetical protein